MFTKQENGKKALEENNKRCFMKGDSELSDRDAGWPVPPHQRVHSAKWKEF